MTIHRRDFVRLAAAATVLPRLRLATALPYGAGARRDTYDVAVIGAGVFGAWTAWELQRAGKRVVLLDAYGPANARASSGGESRVTRLGYGKDEIYTRMALHSLDRWQELSDRAELPILYRVGTLFLVGSDEKYGRESLETVLRVGGRIEELSRAELAVRYPQIALNGITRGQLEPESGALMARRGVLTLVREFVRAGGSYVDEAVAPPSGSGRLAEVTTRNGDRVRADTFVFACGPWLPRVFPALLRGRIHSTRQEVFFFGPAPGDRRFAPPLLPVWLDVSRTSAIMYGMPDLESRGFKIAADAHGPPMDPDTAERRVSAAGLSAARAYLVKRFPALARAPLVESRVCQYENTSNGDFLIDCHPEIENVWLVGGGSGHGFKHGPAVGDYVARAVAGELAAAEPRFSLATKLVQQHRAVF
jgi:glycine/D-amino acid oxidase-like deaminating enzyme